MATRVHLTLIFDEADVPEIAALRREWDPVMAAGVPPHLTLVYPEEYDDEELLIARTNKAVARAPFELRCIALAQPAGDGWSGGVYVQVADPSGAWQSVRGQLLAPPFNLRDVMPHITVVHPRTSERGPEAWRTLGARRFGDELMATEFALTATSPISGMKVLQRFPLAATRRG